MHSLQRFRLVTIAVSLVLAASTAGAESVGFDSERWVVRSGQVTEYLGRQSLSGAAILSDAVLGDGVIEFDISFPELDRRSYPGVLFRIESEGNYERIYLRPHRAPLYPDAIQYVPAFNGIDGWQLYNGDGITAPTRLVAAEWIHLRLEIAGTQARLFVGSEEAPALVIHELERGATSGGMGLMGPPDGSAYFSNFSYSTDSELAFDPPPPVETPPGVITRWELSQRFRMSELDTERSYSDPDLPQLARPAAASRPTGLVDVSRTFGRTGAEPDCVFARTTLHAESDEVRKIAFGYSDAVAVFLNGTILFTGSSSYRERDPSFLGIVGPFDTVYLPLSKGDNELVLLVMEGFGGWGFMARDADAVFLAEGVAQAWDTGKAFRVPESVVWDPDREVLYVSNFDAFAGRGPAGAQSISTVDLDGNVVDKDWVTGLTRPTGMALADGRLLVVDRSGLVEIDVETATITNRYPLPGVRFANDVAVAPDGTIYVSDSAGSKILRRQGGDFEVWIDGGEISQPNGLCVHGTKLLIGNNGDQRLKAVDLETAKVETVVHLPSGVIDGVRATRDGSVLLSHWQGRIYRVSPSGELTKIVDTSVPETNIADFEYVEEHDLFVTPSFYSNSVVAYKVE